MENNKVKPGKWLFGLAAGIGLFGILIVVIASVSVIKKTNNFERIVAPNSKIFYFEEEGIYQIYHEYKSNFEGNYYNSKNLNGLEIRLENVDTHEKIFVTPNIMNSTYNFGGREGRLHSKFKIENPGNYRLTINLDRNSGPTVFAISHGNIGFSIFFLTISIFILIFCLIATKAIIIITFVARRRNIKRL